MRWFGLLVWLCACKSPAPPRPQNPTDTDDPGPGDTDTDAIDDTDTDDTDVDPPGDCEDSAGENHTVHVAVPLVSGRSYKVDPQHDDWFTVQVPANTQVTIDLTFQNGDIDARLRNGPVVASGITTSPNEQLVWDNPGGAVEASLEVYAFGASCLDYTVQVNYQ